MNWASLREANAYPSYLCFLDFILACKTVCVCDRREGTRLWGQNERREGHKQEHEEKYPRHTRYAYEELKNTAKRGLECSSVADQCLHM